MKTAKKATEPKNMPDDKTIDQPLPSSHQSTLPQNLPKHKNVDTTIVPKPYLASFPHEFAVSTLPRPDIPFAEFAPVQKWQRLTPSSYDRNIFHLELDVTNTQRLKHYKMGDALAVYPVNPAESVDHFINSVLLSRDRDRRESLEEVKHQVVQLPPSLVVAPSAAAERAVITSTDASATQVIERTRLFEKSGLSKPSLRCISTVERVLLTILDINGNPTKNFFKQLSRHATDILEKVRLAEFTLERLQEEFKQIVVDSGATYTTVLQAFPSARPSFDVLMDLIPPMKPRLYSVASSALYSPEQLDLLVVVETWKPTEPISFQKLNPHYSDVDNRGCSSAVSDVISCGQLNRKKFRTMTKTATHSIYDNNLLNGQKEGRNVEEHFTDSHQIVPSRRGLCSQHLSTVKPGDLLVASLASSSMQLPPSQLAPVIMAGLGTGMAPFRAFLQASKQLACIDSKTLYVWRNH